MKISGPSLAAPPETRTVLSEGIEIIGEVKFTSAMRVETRISGKVYSNTGNLVVGEKARIDATIEVGSVEVFGAVEGYIKAKYKVQIRAGGRVTGDIFTPDLNIEHGAYFEGRCHVGVSAQPVAVPVPPQGVAVPPQQVSPSQQGQPQQVGPSQQGQPQQVGPSQQVETYILNKRE